MKLLASVSLSAFLLCSSFAMAEGAEKAPADAPAAASTSQLGDLSFFPARYQFVDDFSAEYDSVTSTMNTPQSASQEVKTTIMMLKNRLVYSFFPKQAVLLNLGYESQKNTVSADQSQPGSSANRLQGPELGYKVRLMESTLVNINAEALYDTGFLEKEITYENMTLLFFPRSLFWKGSKFTASAKFSGKIMENLEYSFSPYFIYHAKQKLKLSMGGTSGEAETNSYSDFGISLSGLTHLTNQFSLLIGAMLQRNSTRTTVESGIPYEFPSYETFGLNAGIQANLTPNRVVSYLNFSYFNDSETTFDFDPTDSIPASKFSASGWNATLGVKVAL